MLPANDILLFADIVKFKSFSKAADKHNITAAAVSKRITQLEAQLKVKLLNRSTRKLSLTEAGALLYQHCSKISEDLEQALSLTLDSHQEAQGQIILYAPTNFSNLILAPILPEFLAKHPQIKMRIMIDDSAQLPELGEYDIAIKNSRLLDSNAIARKILDVRMITCASKSYVKQHGTPETPEDLLQHNCIDYTYRNQFDVWHFTRGKKTFDVATHGNLSANNALFVKHLTLAGFGVAWLPNFMIEKELQAGTLIRCLPHYESDLIEVHALHPYANKHVPKKVRVFLDFLIQKLSKTA